MKHSHFWLFVALGIVFGLNGVLVVRLLGQQLLTTGNPLLIVAFLVAIPITLITFAIAKYISKLAFGEMLRPVVVMTFTATWLDAIAFTWLHSLYHDSQEIALHGAALILWGAGLGLFFAYLLEQKTPKHH